MSLRSEISEIYIGMRTSMVHDLKERTGLCEFEQVFGNVQLRAWMGTLKLSRVALSRVKGTSEGVDLPVRE